ncbi:extensin family protein [Aureimonas populi]|uniref:Extensin family protein n=1 Tax=Aureimonas populi TaxID=1701758 RepID=A0ABW5CG75_9HYPH|nr:extensin family protein [Aureimonas populi]
MVLRKRGWRIVTLAAVCSAAAGAFPGLPLAQGFSDASQGNLVWGGHVPPPPRPGEAPVYVPSPAYSAERGYETPAQSNFRGVQPTPPQFLEPVAQPQPQAMVAPDERGPGDYGRTYPVQPAPQDSSYGQPAPVQEAALPPLEGGRVIDDAGGGGLYGSRPDEAFDPWDGSSGADPVPRSVPAPMAAPSGGPVPRAPISGQPGQGAARGAVAPPASAPRPAAAVPSYAAVEQARPERQEGGRGWNPFRWGRGALEDKTPTGYRSLPRGEAMCRRELQRLGVQFTEVSPVGNGGGCGIQNPIRVTQAAKGIAMQPAATLSCQTALQTARWLDNDVRSAARWTLWKRPTAVLNASSYRCSRIAGSRTISEHALGNALDIRGFRFADGSTMDVEPKGLFSPRERKFQNNVRRAGCRYFGTVLGPGYNKAHDDHLHFDVKTRSRSVCK